MRIDVVGKLLLRFVLWWETVWADFERSSLPCKAIIAVCGCKRVVQKLRLRLQHCDSSRSSSPWVLIRVNLESRSMTYR